MRVYAEDGVTIERTSALTDAGCIRREWVLARDAKTGLVRRVFGMCQPNKPDSSRAKLDGTRVANTLRHEKTAPTPFHRHRRGQPGSCQLRHSAKYNNHDQHDYYAIGDESRQQ